MLYGTLISSIHVSSISVLDEFEMMRILVKYLHEIKIELVIRL